MAEVDYTKIEDGRSVKLVQWTGLTNNDTGKAFVCEGYTDKTVQVYGTFQDGTCTIQGTLDVSSPTYATLNDAGGTSLGLTSAGIKKIRENAYAVRPYVTGAEAGASLTVNLLLVLP